MDLINRVRYEEDILFKTVNSGQSWSVQLSETKYSFLEIQFLTSKIGFILARDRIKQNNRYTCYLLKTSDGGNSWTESKIDVNSFRIQDIHFTSQDTGYCCYQHIYKTTDGGKTWVKKLNQGYYTDYHCIQFVNDSVGWAAGQAIHKTTDGGETWTLQKRIANYASYGPNVDQCYFINEMKGWVSSGSFAFFTHDGGRRWERYNSYNSMHLSHFCFVDDSIGYALNAEYGNGELYKTTSGGINSSIINRSENNLPTIFKLEQNYPNPFNASTTINFSIKKPEQIILKIYNLSGQEIAKLVDGFRTTGEHEITWQPKGLASGIYFYRLQAGDPSASSPWQNTGQAGQRFSETKKLILQK